MTNDEVREATPDDARLVIEYAFGGVAAQAMRAALRLRVVELIGDKETTADDVAARAAAAPQPMARLLRALASMGLLEERAAGTFAVTPAGALLDPARPGSLASIARMFTDPMMLRGWERLDDSVRTGDIAFDQVFGTDFFGHLKQHPDLSAEFNKAMSQGTRQTAAALPGAVDFGRFKTVMDIGGGDGTLLSAVLREHPAVTGVVYDTEEGLAQAPATLSRDGLTDRCSLVAGDFFRSVPEGADLHMMKSIVHDWSDDQVVTILSHCRAALPPGGRVLIVEPVLPETVDPQTAGRVYLSDLNMLVNVGGRERTRAEFEEVCRRAGFTVTSVTPLPQAPPFHAIEAEVAAD
ncbi:methyltransferase [Streptomyces flavofungini]|uniref:methyltransferase n=1 Tax=Streptomyces flavofungini TaxID=68200 RepID=UPI0025B08FCB|nr:methyltransferase [Streptomyces flavofungini]WJV50824.1 methyltransferase [Streptomyces flavofungini]